MKIREVRVDLVPTERRSRLLAYVSITMESPPLEFAIRDIRIITGRDGPFIAMPSRKNADHCVECNYKNHLTAKFCNECGVRQPPGRLDCLKCKGGGYNEIGEECNHCGGSGDARLFFDICFPTNRETRVIMDDAILNEYRRIVELEKESA